MPTARRFLLLSATSLLALPARAEGCKNCDELIWQLLWLVVVLPPLFCGGLVYVCLWLTDRQARLWACLVGAIVAHFFALFAAANAVAGSDNQSRVWPILLIVLIDLAGAYGLNQLFRKS